MKELQGNWALVTGASSGIGADLARLLGEAGCHLVLTARRKDRLESLKNELTDKYPIKIETISNDLSKTTGAKQLFDAVEAKKISIDILVNNAGIGLHGKFAELDIDAQLGLIQLNVTSPTELTHRFMQGMVSRKKGWILQVASLYAFSHGTNMAMYAASKHFMLCMSDALNDELKGSGVNITALCPGVTKTEFFEAADMSGGMVFDMIAMNSMDVARQGIRAMVAGKPYIVTGAANQMIALGSPFTPRPFKILGSKLLHSIGS